MAVFEPDDVVCAVKDAGSLIGLVGERGLGFTKPVCGGEGGILVFVEAPCAALVAGLLAGFVVWLEAAAGLLSFFSTFFSGGFVDSFGRPLGVVGVLGAAGDLIAFGDGFEAADVFAVEIGVGRAENLPEAGLSTLFPVVIDLLPTFVCPLDAALLATVFLRSVAPLVLFVAFVSPPSCLSTSIEGVSTATSGMVSSITVLFFRTSNSVAIDCFRSAVVFGCSSSSILKLVLRLAILGSPLFSRFKPNWFPSCPLLSTATKLVRTFERGLGDVPLLPAPKMISKCSLRMTVSDKPIEPAGDRPRSGGLVDVSLFSNIARRLRTPPDILTDFELLLLARFPNVFEIEESQESESCEETRTPF